MSRLQISTTKQVYTWLFSLLIVSGCGPAREPLLPTDVPTPDEAVVVEVPDAVVSTTELNVRSGPGADYPVVEIVVKTAPLAVLGQAYQCSWLEVTTQSGSRGWVSRPFVDLNQPCDQIALASIPPLPDSPNPVQSESAGSTLTESAGSSNLDSDATISLLQPLDRSLGGRQHFIWRSSQALTADQAYELIFWRPGRDPLQDGISPFGITSLNQTTFNMDEASNNMPQLEVGKDYLWSVALVNNTSRERLTLLHPGHRFHLSFYGADQKNNDPKNASVPPTNTPVATALPLQQISTPSSEVIGTTGDDPPTPTPGQTPEE